MIELQKKQYSDPFSKGRYILVPILSNRLTHPGKGRNNTRRCFHQLCLFVQEVVERLPTVRHCSQYRSLRSRNGYSVSPLVGNGLLLVDAKRKACEEDTRLDSLERACQRAKAGLVVDPISANHCLPSGKILGAKLPPQLVGDILQVFCVY